MLNNISWYNLVVKRLFLLSLCVVSLAASAYAAAPKVALVLSGGIVTRGLSEIGVIKALEEEHIPIDYVVGTSMGAVLGSLVAQGYTADEIEKVARAINWTEAFAKMQDYRNLLFGEKEKFGRYLLSLDLNGFKPIIPASLVAPQKPSILFTEISIDGLSVRDFNKFKVPYRANATDLETGKEVVFSSGYIPKVLQASSAVPVMMAPVEIDGKLLIDGGTVNNLPVNIAKGFKPDVIIAVNLGMGLKPKEELGSFMSTLSQCLAYPAQETIEKHRKMADVLIEPDISKYGIADFAKIDEIIEVGYKAAKAKMPEIKRLLTKKGYVFPSEKITRLDGSKKIDRIAIAGNTVYPQDDLFLLLSSKPGQVFDPAKTKKDKNALRDKYRFDGYRLASVEAYSQDGVLHFYIYEGYLDDIRISGMENISDVFLKRKIHQQKVFNTNQVEADIDRLYATGFFESANFTVYPGDKGWILEYQLKERSRNNIALGLRFDTYQQLSLLADLKIKYLKSQNLTQTLSLKVGNEFDCRLVTEFWPKRSGNNLVGEAAIFINKNVQDIYNTGNNQIQSSFYYLPKGLRLAAKANLEPFGQISSGFQFSQVNYEYVFSLFPNENVSKLFLRTEIDSLDNPISPRNGIALSLEYQHAGKALYGEYEFSKALADLSIYVSLPRQHVAFAKGHLQLGRGDLPLSERYRLGGEENLLGYGRTQYVGKDAAALRLGYRIPLYISDFGIFDRIYLSLLQDFGIAAAKMEDFSTQNLLSGFGAELQAGTIIGLSSKLSIGFGQRTLYYFAIGNEF